MAAAIPFVVAAVSAAGAMSSANAAKASANYNAAVDAQKAGVALEQGSQQEQQQRRTAAFALGKEAAGAADNGFGLDGSAADLYQQSATSAELDALNIRYGAKMQGAGFMEQRGLDQMRATAAGNAGPYNAGAAALSSYGTYLSSRTITAQK